MKRIKLEQNSEEWLRYRLGKVTGSKLKDIVTWKGTARKIGQYELVAERLSIDPFDIDDPRERGHRLEQEGVLLFASEILGKKVKTDCGVWVSDEDPNMGISPDGEVGTTGAIEIKCLSSAKHLQAYFEQQIPSEYYEQSRQYFIINEKLKVLYFVFYDPRIPSMPLHHIEVHRKDVKDEIEFLRGYEKDTLKWVNERVNQLMPI